MGENDGFLNEDIRDQRANSPLTVREYLGNEFGVECYYRHPRHWGRRAIYSIDEPAATIRSTNRPIPPKYRVHPLDAAPIGDCIEDYEVKREVSLEKDFRAWLRETQCYTDRSAGNVISRLKRVRKLIGPVTLFHETVDAIHALEKAPEFSWLSSSVKSQLRRAIYLRSEFAGRR
jgi:DNA (cytosine-5)-methyltransferase 1